MKKILCLAVAVLLIFTFAACGNDSGSTDNSGNNAAVHSFTVNGTEVKMGVDATEILKNLGEPKSKTEEASCAFEGLDRTYFYGNFYMTTYPNGEKENVFGAWFVDDTVSTAEGIYIGSSKADVEKAYGADSFNGSNAYVVEKGKSKLTVIIKDDKCSAITYDAIVD
jgi:hypothetical protein